MAYFSNGSEGQSFDDQCGKCKYGQAPCPIAWVQTNYNYDQHNDKSGTATNILNDLVKKDGTCTMRELIYSHKEVDPNQTELF
jgi:hypothetical protein